LLTDTDETRSLCSLTTALDHGHHVVQHRAVLGAVKVSSLRSDTAFRGASNLDGVSAQRGRSALT
jgi:hypothetical protein